MNTLSRKIIVLAIAVTMVFAVAVLGGCGVTPELTLQQQADAIGAQVFYWQNGGNPTLDDIDALLTQLAELRAEVERLHGGNEALLARISGYEARLKSLRNKGMPVDINYEILNEIKKDYFTQVIAPTGPIEFCAISIEKVLGMFDGFIVIRFSQHLSFPSTWNIVIGGIEFDGCVATRTVAWKNGRLYSIIAAYDNNILTQKSVYEISKIYNLPYQLTK